jgi:predicted RNase H-like HicB family nuclease
LNDAQCQFVIYSSICFLIIPRASLIRSRFGVSLDEFNGLHTLVNTNINSDMKIHSTNVNHRANASVKNPNASIKKYLIVIEKSAAGYLAWSPDLEGCTATGETKQNAQRSMEEAIKMHLYWLHIDGFPIPEPNSRAGYVEIAA